MFCADWIYIFLPLNHSCIFCYDVQSFTELEYLVLGLVSTVPAFVIPLLFVGKVIWHALPTLSSDQVRKICSM